MAGWGGVRWRSGEETLSRDDLRERDVRFRRVFWGRLNGISKKKKTEIIIMKIFKRKTYESVAKPVKRF